MKTRWNFHIECDGIRFERVHTFHATMTEQHSNALGLRPESFDAEVVIEPDDESYDPDLEQTGMLKITLPGEQEQTKRAAYWLAKNTTEQVAFSQGKLRVNYGLVTGQHLPETEEEQQRVGNAPYFYYTQFIEVKPTPVFQGESLTSVSASPLLQQFNDADNANNPIDRFLGLFRILEDTYGPSDKKTFLAKALKSSTELFQIAEKQIYIQEAGKRRTITRTDFSSLIDRFVKARHQCAHLRRKKNFGITHGDPRVRKEIEPLANIARELAREAIKLHA